MPFTPAHALAVLPAVRWHAKLRLDPTCLVLGSMIPDFEYFARGEQVGRFGHTFASIATWGIPATLVLAAVFQLVVKWPMLLAAPGRWTPVFAAPWPVGRGVRSIAAISASLVISAALGDLTHLLWDGVTHSDGAIARNVSVLRTPIDVPGLGPMVLHRVIQHTSTLVGLAVICAYLAVQIRRASPPGAVVRRARARATFAICIAIGTALLLSRAWWLLHLRDPGSLISAAISGALAGTIVASLVLRRDGRRWRQLTS